MSDFFRLAPFLALGSVNTTGSCIAEERSGTSRVANGKALVTLSRARYVQCVGL